MTDYFYLKGNDSLVIWKKYLESINSSPYRFIKELIYKLIEKNKERFIYEVEKGNIMIPKGSKLYILYTELKEQIQTEEYEKTPDFEELGLEELREIKKNLTK